MNHRSRPQGLALIALAATHLSNLNAGPGAAKPFASFDAGDLGMDHHTNKVGVMDLMAAGAKQHGYTSTLRS